MNENILSQYKLYFKIKEKVESIYSKKIFKIFQCVLTIFSLFLTLFVNIKNYVLLSSIVVTINLLIYGFILIFGILFTEDFSNLFLPIMLLPMGLMKLLNIDLRFYLKFAGLVIIFLLSILIKIYLNYKVYQRKIKKGAFFYQTLFVSFAVSVGGLLYYNLSAFQNYIGLVYYIFLGPLFIVSYVYMVNNTNVKKENSINDLVKDFIYIGFAVSIIIFIGHVFVIIENVKNLFFGSGENFTEVIKSKDILNLLTLQRGNLTQWRNLASQQVLFCVPAVYYKIMNDKKTKSYIIGVIFCVAPVISGSRNGLIFGFLALLFLTYIFLKVSKKEKVKISIIIIFLITGVLILFIMKIISEYKIDSIIKKILNIENEARIKLYKEAIINFLREPFFGVGILYYPKNLAYQPSNIGMYWIHSNVLQVMSSFGLLGVLAYSSIIIKRFKVFSRKKNKYSKMAIFTYVLFLALGLFDIVGFSIFASNFMMLYFASFIENQNEKENIIEKSYFEDFFNLKFKDPKLYFD